jgi:rhodanese-related sulfurtransferase
VSESQPKAAQMVAWAKGRVENLTPQAAGHRALEAGEEATLVDIREDDERLHNWAIPDAVRALGGMLEFWADPTNAYHREEFDPAGRTILYCASGGVRRLRRARCRGWATVTLPPRWGHHGLEGGDPLEEA